MTKKKVWGEREKRIGMKGKFKKRNFLHFYKKILLGIIFIIIIFLITVTNASNI